MNHPNAIRLEAFACGEPAPDVEEHLRACEACSAFVAKARAAAIEAPPVDLARLLAAGAAARPASSVASRALVVALPLAAAALLWVGAGARNSLAPTPGPVLTASAVAAASDPDTTFKGGVQVSVIRERGAAQDRFVGDVRVTAGDRLRIEVALDRPQAILGAIVGDDGTYVEMMAGDVRSAGTHLSERSARVDAHPLHGTILVGPPEAVARARATGQLAGVARVRVEWEASP